LFKGGSKILVERGQFYKLLISRRIKRRWRDIEVSLDLIIASSRHISKGFIKLLRIL
jgi:hypothetical protein